MDAAICPFHPRPCLTVRREGFSLVEVTLAIGIVVFALLPLVGLLSVGLKSYQNSNQRGPASQAVSQIASCLRLATDTDADGKSTGLYTASAPLGTAVPPVTWKLDGATASYPLYFDKDGNLVAARTINGLAAMLVLTAPKRANGASTPGTARIAVAWPVVAAPAYSGGTISFTNFQGHEEATVSFGPNQP